MRGWEGSHWLWSGLHIWDYFFFKKLMDRKKLSRNRNIQWMTKILTLPAGKPGTPMKWIWFCANAIVGWYPAVFAPGVIEPEEPSDKSGCWTVFHGMAVELAALRRPMSSEYSEPFEYASIGNKVKLIDVSRRMLEMSQTRGSCSSECDYETRKETNKTHWYHDPKWRQNWKGRKCPVLW